MRRVVGEENGLTDTESDSFDKMAQTNVQAAEGTSSGVSHQITPEMGS